VKRLVNVLEAERCRTSIGGHELAGLVDVLHIMHNTESKVTFNIISLVHPGGDLIHKVINLLLVGLSTAVEVLACKLRDVDGQLEGVVEILNVLDEARGCYIIIMKSDSVDITATVADAEKVLHPLLSRGSGCRGRRDVSVALRLEWIEVLEPEIYTTLRSHIRLTLLIRLVKAKGILGVASHDKSLEIVGLSRFVTPELGHVVKFKRVGSLRLVGTPCVYPANFVRDKLGKTRIVTIGPGKANFALTAT